MNFIVAMLLMNLHNEEDSFWCLVYIMFPKKGVLGIKGKHNWRQIFIDMMPKAISLDKKLRVKLAKQAPQLLINLLEHTDGETLIPITCGTCSSIFVSDQSHEIGRRLFEIFLVRGENFIILLLVKCLIIKQSYIINSACPKILYYIRQAMIKDCLKEKGSLHNIL